MILEIEFLQGWHCSAKLKERLTAKTKRIMVVQMLSGMFIRRSDLTSLPNVW